MECYIEGCAYEIGWLCAAKRDDAGNIFIYDAFLFRQDVHHTTTEITPEGLTEFATDLLTLPNGMELWNDIKAWGHSHVNMGVTPSGQDDKQMRDFANVGFPWFIRIIGNKKGDMRVDLWDYAARIEYSNLEWEVAEDEREDEVSLKMQQLEDWYEAELTKLDAEIKAIREAGKKELKTPIDAEIKEKVKYKTYVTPNYGSTYGGRNTPSAGTHYPQQTSLPITEEDVKKNNVEGSGASVGSTPRRVLELVSPSESGSSELDFIYNINVQYFKYFTYSDAWEIAEVEDMGDLKDFLWEAGIQIDFSTRDLQKIHAFATNLTQYYSRGGY
jgi:hypothetical protein